MTYKEIRKNKEIKAFIKRAGINLTSLGFTDHSEVHTTLVADRAAAILKEFGYDEHTIELAKIAGYMHDIPRIFLSPISAMLSTVPTMQSMVQYLQMIFSKVLICP